MVNYNDKFRDSIAIEPDKKTKKTDWRKILTRVASGVVGAKLGGATGVEAVRGAFNKYDTNKKNENIRKTKENLDKKTLDQKTHRENYQEKKETYTKRMKEIALDKKEKKETYKSRVKAIAQDKKDKKADAKYDLAMETGQLKLKKLKQDIDTKKAEKASKSKKSKTSEFDKVESAYGINKPITQTKIDDPKKQARNTQALKDRGTSIGLASKATNSVPDTANGANDLLKTLSSVNVLRPEQKNTIKSSMSDTLYPERREELRALKENGWEIPRTWEEAVAETHDKALFGQGGKILDLRDDVIKSVLDPIRNSNFADPNMPLFPHNLPDSQRCMNFSGNGDMLSTPEPTPFLNSNQPIPRDYSSGEPSFWDILNKGRYAKDSYSGETPSLETVKQMQTYIPGGPPPPMQPPIMQPEISPSQMAQPALDQNPVQTLYSETGVPPYSDGGIANEQPNEARKMLENQIANNPQDKISSLSIGLFDDLVRNDVKSVQELDEVFEEVSKLPELTAMNGKERQELLGNLRSLYGSMNT